MRRFISFTFFYEEQNNKKSTEIASLIVDDPKKMNMNTNCLARKTAIVMYVYCMQISRNLVEYFTFNSFRILKIVNTRMSQKP